MSQVLEFPSPDDRQVVMSAVNLFLSTGNVAVRMNMLRTARKVLDKFRISRLHLPGILVRAAGKSLCSFEARSLVEGDRCPGCGADIYAWPGKVRIISINEGCRYDLVTYGCKCGSLFAKQENVN